MYPRVDECASDASEDERWVADSLRLCRLTDGGPRVVHGHYLLTWYAERFPRANRIAWIRHPVERIVSFYYMWREMDVLPTASPVQRAVRDGRLDLVEFARLPVMRDQVTRRFLGERGGRGLNFIGLQERFDEDLSSLARLLGWAAVRSAKSNVNKSALYAARDVDGDTRSLIAKLNPADMELYDEVRSGRWTPRS